LHSRHEVLRMRGGQRTEAFLLLPKLRLDVKIASLGDLMTEPRPVNIVDFRAEHYSPDGKAVVVSFATELSAERRSYALPVQSLYEFIADLQNLQTGRLVDQGEEAKSDMPPTVSNPSPAPPAPDQLDRVTVALPKKWMLKALPERNAVLMVFDPQTVTQSGFALSGSSAREMAMALVKCAEGLPIRELGKAKRG
jgi:hypothetical protein